MEYSFRWCLLSICIGVLLVLGTSVGMTAGNDQLTCNIKGSDIDYVIAAGSAIAFVFLLVGVIFASIEIKTGAVNYITITQSSGTSCSKNRDFSNKINIVFVGFLTIFAAGATILDFLSNIMECTTFRQVVISLKSIIITTALIHGIILIAAPSKLGYKHSKLQSC